jgi:glycosyltransferase involved in cell wall biosynthesis
MASKRFSVVLTLHGPSFLDDWSNADRKRTHLENLRRIRAIGVPSLFERERQIEFGVESDRVFAVPDPLTCYSAERGALRKSICIPDRDCVVIYCGRLTPQKGVNTLIETAELMLPSRRDVHFVIAGDGPLLEKCRQTASRFPSQFHVLGHIDDVGAVYADGDIYVSPSSCESFGISAMEAGLSGKPMLLSRIRPWTDVLTEGTDCYFFTDGKTSDFAQKLERLIESPQDRNRLADNARLSIMSQFSDLAICDALEKMYNCRRNSAI